MEFRLNNERRGGWNLVRLRWENGTLIFDRLYRGIESSIITHVFDNRDRVLGGRALTLFNVARMIHWGCNGYTANNHYMAKLREKLQPFVDPADTGRKCNEVALTGEDLIEYLVIRFGMSEADARERVAQMTTTQTTE